MHPDPAFGWTDMAAMQAFVADEAFAHIFAGDGVIHSPVVVASNGSLQWHVARRNRVTPMLADQHVTVSVLGPHGYLSPDWYAAPAQVPTWNYVAVEIVGTARALSQAALIAQLDRLVAINEAALAPKPAWTSAAVPAPAMAAMVDAIAGFELVDAIWRGTRKLSQNKHPADRAGVITTVQSRDPALAAAMRQ